MYFSLPEAVRDLTLNFASSDMVSPIGSLRFEFGLVTSLEMGNTGNSSGYIPVGGYGVRNQGGGWRVERGGRVKLRARLRHVTAAKRDAVSLAEEHKAHIKTTPRESGAPSSLATNNKRSHAIY